MQPAYCFPTNDLIYYYVLQGFDSKQIGIK